MGGKGRGQGEGDRGRGKGKGNGGGGGNGKENRGGGDKGSWVGILCRMDLYVYDVFMCLVFVVFK